MTAATRSVVVLAALTAVAVVAVDQAAKTLALSSLGSSSERDLIGTTLKLVDVRNTGVAFGKFSGGGVIVAVLVLLALGCLVWYFLRHLETPLIWLPTGMVVGGAIGNIVDRIRIGAVTDFIKLPHWPAFNFADAAITGGVIALVVLVEIDARRTAQGQ